METRQISAMLSQLLSLILMHQLSDKSRGSHTGRSGMSRRTHLSSHSLGNGTRAKLKNCMLGVGAGSRNRLVKPRRTIRLGAQQLLHGDSGDGNRWWPFRMETHR